MRSGSCSYLAFVPGLRQVVLVGSLTAAHGLALACGGQDGDGSSSAGESTTGGPTSSGGEPTTTAANSSGTTGTAACEDPSDANLGPEVLVTLRNAGAAPIYVSVRSDCDRGLAFDLHASDGHVLRTSLGSAGDVCSWSCDHVLGGGACACPMGCVVWDEVVQIDPGAAYAQSWPGDEYRSAALDAACADETCGPSCAARMQAPSGLYTVVARAGDAIDGCPTCGCEAGPAGWCIVEGRPGGTETNVMAMLEFPQQTALELVFP